MSAAVADEQVVSPRLDPLEVWLAPIYFAAYLAYLFWHPESELHHWLSLVLVPTLLVLGLRRARGTDLTELAAAFGLRRDGLRRGLWLAILLGLAAGLFQLWGSRSANDIASLIRSGRAVYLFPLAFLLMAATAGFTEEFFFRGFLQTRLESLFRSRIAGLVAAALCFGVYHLPYAYLNPNWPSAGDWGAAWSAALGQGVPAGLILGGLYLIARRNLLSCVVLHSMINAVPAMTMIDQLAS